MWVTIWMVDLGVAFFFFKYPNMFQSAHSLCSSQSKHSALVHSRKYLATQSCSSTHILRVAPMIEATPPAMTYFSPVVVPKPVSRSHLDRDVALRRLGCMVDLTHGSLGDYATVHNLYTSSPTNGNRAQSIKWMKQVNHHFWFMMLRFFNNYIMVAYTDLSNISITYRSPYDFGVLPKQETRQFKYSTNSYL